MSLNSRAIAALGAVVVVGAATVGTSVAIAADQTEHISHQATLTVGNSSFVAQPLCWNNGSPLTEDLQQKCQEDAQDALKNGTLPSSDVVASDRVGVGVSPNVADSGWWAFTNGGSSSSGGRTSLAVYAKGPTWSGAQQANKVLNASGKTLVTVVEGDKNSDNPIAVWYFQLNTQDS
ncbi:hypothetical protein ATKI12_1310 [Kitasatospora sp. Ki12]|uniref:hypothetical protein n=1 Tax=Kitasatospora xanthocidica TaxID=83382 RepID=UPI001674C2C0|nr:hypothetical protein [Kitasatospora xanthocidica]GHF64831.1 hypothetical protein GCM10018790_48360 [Kitasatospora xanthocidica]